MRRPFRWDKKYLYWGITAFCVVAAAILFYMALNYIGAVGSAISALFKILSPFIWGLVISYLLGPLVRTLENKVFRPLASKLYKKNKRSDGHGFARGMSILFSEIIMLAVIAALIYLIIPQLYSSIETIVVNSPTYIDNGTQWLTKLLEDYPEIEEYAVQALGDMNEFLANWLKNTVLPGLGNLITNVGAGVYYVVMAVYNLIIGIIVSVYMLGSKETFKANAKRVMYTLFSVETVKKIFDGLDFTDKTFMGFINGKILDSAIIGLICYIGCVLLRMPYALLISVIVGVTNIIPFFGPFIGAVPSALLVLLVDPIVSVMSTPAEAVGGTARYLTVCFIGIPFITAYNIISSIFRGMGDSKSPMYFVAIACIINIALDYLLMGVFSLGPSGAALGTTLSQMCSVLIALVVIIKKRMFPGFRLRDLHLHKTTIASILQVGIPVAFQDGFIQVSFLVITMFANQRGLNDAAAVGIVEKLIGILFLVPSSLLSTVSALSAQNLGAGKPERARQTLRYAICITFSFGLVISIAMQFAAGAAVSLFTDEAEVVRLGTQYMKSYVLDCMIAGIHFCCSGFFCACGLSGLSFLHNCISIVVARIPLAWLACRYFPETLYPMGLAAPIGSLISVAICLIALRWIRRHPEKLVMNLHPVETE